MKDFYYTLLLMSVVAAALYLILRLLSRFTQSYFSATWHYYSHVFLYTLFFIPYFKLVSFFYLNIPESVQNKLRSFTASIQNGFGEPSQLIIISDGNRLITTDQLSRESSDAVLSLLNVIPYFLAAGTLIFLAVTLIQNMKIDSRIFSLCEQTDDPDLLRELSASKQKLGMTKEIPVYLSPYASSPFLYGMFKPRIVLPAVIDFTAEEYRQVFLHELTHYKRRDVWVKCLFIAINALHWFNPLAYMARRDADRYCELSCDERIVQSMNSAERRRYCELLLNVLWNVADQKAKLYSAFSDKRSYLERRISMILKNEGAKRKKPVRMLAVTMTLTLALVGTGAVYAGSEGRIDSLTGFNLNNSSGDGAITSKDQADVSFGAELNELNRVNVQNEKGDGAVTASENGSANIGFSSSSEIKMVNIAESSGDGAVTLSKGSSEARFIKNLPENALNNSTNPEVSKSSVTKALSNSAQQFRGNLNQDSGYTNKKQTIHEGASVTITATLDRPQDFHAGVYSHTTGKAYYETLSNDSETVTFDILATGEYSIYVGNPSVGDVNWSVSYEVN
ncbi:M56 family metallopeptidase [Paenibacillus sp. J2TS4]|uniref:M56 family metallopeptidase n=1 Tax=Paenibacillus sp. J2TS4 TaxID=2807194 RepID=UPI001B009009|nr:M56 family metallopeptidase [Paenibacillus sp. J2TS4]GIP34882.1 Zn-dependent protease [Paenibacillus sp. J2TS4]